MKVDEVGVTVKQQQQMTQPEDSMVFEELKLTVPEAATLEVSSCAFIGLVIICFR